MAVIAFKKKYWYILYKKMNRTPHHSTPTPLLLKGGHIKNHTGWSIFQHTDEGLELVFLKNGRQIWNIDRTVVEITAPALLYEFPWQSHFTVETTACELYWAIFAFSSVENTGTCGFHTLATQSPLPLASLQTLEQDLRRQKKQYITPDASFISLFTRLVSAGDGVDDISRLLAQALVPGVFADLIRLTRQNNDRTRPAGSYEHVSAYISRPDFPPNLPLDRMAAACGLGRTYFASLIKKITGMPPGLYVTKRKIERACRLLRQTRKPVTEIAYELGFSSSQYFATVFRKITGEQPRDYRRKGPPPPGTGPAK